MGLLLRYWNLIVLTLFVIFFISCNSEGPTNSLNGEPQDSNSTFIIGHTKADISQLQTDDVLKAKDQLHIAYGHTSHGSQLTTGMQGLISFKGELYSFSNGGENGVLDLRDRPFSGASDLGNPDRTEWANATRNYLLSHQEINVIIWSWCGQVSSASEEDINIYLNLMNGLEVDFPDVKFIYMTGHLDGSGADGNLNKRNEQIREYCRANEKLLYDFADIESYDPNGEINYMLLNANDNCDYDSNGDGSRDVNWAINWQNSHIEGVDWYSCSSAHSQSLNANRKAYAAWNLWVSLVE